MSEEKKLSLDEALALLDKHTAEDESKKKKDPAKEKVKDLILEGAKQGRGGLNKGSRRQLDILEKEGY